MVLPRGGRVAVPGSGMNFFEGGVFAELFVAWVLFRAGRDILREAVARPAGRSPAQRPAFPHAACFKRIGKVPRGFSVFSFWLRGVFWSGRAEGLRARVFIELAEHSALPTAGKFFAVVTTRGVPEADSTFRATRGDFRRSLDCLFFCSWIFFRHVLLTQNFLVGNVFFRFLLLLCCLAAMEQQRVEFFLIYWILFVVRMEEGERRFPPFSGKDEKFFAEMREDRGGIK